MKRLLSLILYKWMGWKEILTVPKRKKAIFCVAPHTSNLDFIIAIMYDRSYGGRAHFLMKKSWFFWPLGAIFRSWGGIAVDRSHKGKLTDDLAEQITNAPDEFQIAITPEGTRSANGKWKLGFYYIAQKAGVPIRLYVLDYSTKTIRCNEEFWPTDDAEADIKYIKDYYSRFRNAARYPDKFSV